MLPSPQLTSKKLTRPRHPHDDPMPHLQRSSLRRSLTAPNPLELNANSYFREVQDGGSSWWMGVWGKAKFPPVAPLYLDQPVRLTRPPAILKSLSSFIQLSPLF